MNKRVITAYYNEEEAEMHLIISGISESDAIYNVISTLIGTPPEKFALKKAFKNETENVVSESELKEAVEIKEIAPVKTEAVPATDSKDINSVNRKKTLKAARPTTKIKSAKITDSAKSNTATVAETADATKTDTKPVNEVKSASNPKEAPTDIPFATPESPRDEILPSLAAAKTGERVHMPAENAKAKTAGGSNLFMIPAKLRNFATLKTWLQTAYPDVKIRKVTGKPMVFEVVSNVESIANDKKFSKVS